MTTKLTTSNLSAETLAAISGPRISNVKIADSSYNTLDDTAANISGGFIIINGQNFISNCQVLIDNTPATTVTFVSNSVIRAQVPASAEGTTKSIYVVNPDGSSAIIINGLTYSAFPAWSTGSTLTSFEALVPVSIQLSAPSATVYTLAAANTLPSSLSLYANGLIAGTVAANTTTNYNFTVNAKDAENQDTNRNFTLPITQNIEPAWVTAADLGSAFVDANYSNTLVATDLSNITYSVAAGSSLPSSLTLAANGLLSGSVSAANTYSFGIVATDTANLSNTRTFSITISFSNDTYFKNTTLLLNGETTVTPFISDASTNSFGLTINGDTKPTLFNPYQEGYYSNYFDGTGDYLTVPNNVALQFSTGDFTVELWWYPTSVASDQGFLGGGYDFCWRTSTGLNIGRINIAFDNTFNFTPTVNQWYHIAYSRSGTSLKVFVNGSQVGSTATNSISYDSGGSGAVIGGSTTGDRLLTGYISNLRLVKGTAVYTSNFTPSTSPLTAIANTSLLTCQSNRFIDNSTNNFTITKAGDVSVSPNIPFTQNSSYSTYGSTYFDGTGDYLTIPSPTTGFSLGTGEFTIECWVYKLSAVNAILVDSRPSGEAGPWAFVIDGSNFPYFYDGTVYTSTVAVTLNSWNHVAVVRTSGVLKIFVNGVQGYSASYGTNLDRTAGLVIGMTAHGLALLLGYISDLRIVKGTAVYTTAFTPPTVPLTAIANTQLLTLQYNGGANNKGIIDNSNFNNIVTRNGNTSQGTFSPYSVTGWSNYFSSNYLSFPNSSAFAFGTGAFTIEFWINAPSLLNDKFFISGRGAIGTMHITSGGYGGSTAGSLRYVGSSTITSGSTLVADGSWHHCAIVRDGSNNITLYVDGVSRGTGTDSTNYTTTAGTWYLNANDSGPTAGGDAYYSNLRIVKGTAVYNSAFTPSTTPFTPITNTQLLIAQSNRFVDNSPNNLALTLNGTPSVQALDPFGSVPEAVPISYSNYFDGTGDYLTVPDNVVLQLGSGDFTVEFWINYSSIAGYPTPFNKGYTAAGDILLQTGNGNGALIVYLSGSAVITESTGASIGTWYHYALVRSGTTVTLYRDGVSRGTATSSVNFNTTNQLAIGATGKAPGGGAIGDYAINGYMSNFRLVKGTAVYTSAFTPTTTPLTAISGTQLLTCQSTTMIDNSTNAFTITANGNTKPRQYNPFGYTAQTYTNYSPTTHGGSAYFDGTGDYLSIGTTQLWTPSNNLTIEGWFNISTTGNRCIFSKDSGSTGSSRGLFIYITSTGAVSVFYSVSGSSEAFATSSTGLVVANQWYHLAVVKNGSSCAVYLNGVSIVTFTAATIACPSSPTNYIGIFNASYPMLGYISDLRIVNGTAVYTSNFVPPTQTLTNYSTTYPASLLCKFNNGGIIDQHGTNVLETVGNAQLSTAVKKYGNASMYFDGSSRITIPASPQWIFGTGDFTVEFWMNTADTGAGLITPATTGSGYWALMIYSGSLYWQNAYNISNLKNASLSGYLNNTWVHIAVVRYSGNLYFYFNGTAQGSATADSTNYSGVTNTLTIGYDGAQNGYYSGYIDDLRITKGVARYTSNFTAPTIAFIAK